MSRKASTYQLFLKGIKDIYNILDELERKHSELDHRLEKKYSEMNHRVGMLDSLKILNRDIAELRQKMASLESAAKGELSSASPGVKGKEAITTADLFTLPDTLRKAYLALAEIGGEAHPKAVAEKTGRTRGFESVNLNRLCALGYAQKVRRKREVRFKAIPRTLKATC